MKTIFIFCEMPAAGRLRFVTALGEDGLSDRLIEAFRSEGLVTDLVFRLAGPRPGLYLIETDRDGERRFRQDRFLSRGELGEHRDKEDCGGLGNDHHWGDRGPTASG